MLTFQHLLDNGQIPANSFKTIEGKVYLDVGQLIEEPVSTLSSPKVVELAIKLLMSCNKAQAVYNNNALVGQRIGSFSDPVSGTAQQYLNVSPPGYYSTMQCTVVGLVPADINNVVAVFQ